jgi:hypothetical protein
MWKEIQMCETCGMKRYERAEFGDKHTVPYLPDNHCQCVFIGGEYIKPVNPGAVTFG